MLRFEILASAVPLLILGFFARGELLPGPHPCIAVADTSVRISDMPWVADLHVAFTDDPKLATVRVQLSDSADAADFAVIDDAGSAETGSCEANPATRLGLDLGKSLGGFAGDLSLAGRPRRLPDLRALENLHRARRGGAGGRRRRRTAKACRRLALSFSVFLMLHPALTLFASPHPTPCNPQALCKVKHSMVGAGSGATRQVSGSSAGTIFPDQVTSAALLPAPSVADLHCPLLHDLFRRVRRFLWFHRRKPLSGCRLRPQHVCDRRDFLFALACLALATLSFRMRLLRQKLRKVALHNETLADRNWELQEAEQRVRSLFESQGDLIVLRDAEGRISFANDAFCELASQPREALIGSKFTFAVLEQGDTALESSGTRIHDQKIAGPLGRRWIAWREGWVRSDAGQPAELQCVGRDVTDRTETERARRKPAIRPTPPTAPSRASWRWPATKSARR